MSPENPNPAAGDAAGSGNAVCFGGEQFPDSAPAQKNQAKILRLAPPQRRRIVEVRISARDHHQPIGRTRAMLLHEADLERLIEAAERLERAS
jgi:hypothetical protein